MEWVERLILYLSYASYVLYALVLLDVDAPRARAWAKFLEEIYPAAIGAALVLTANPLVKEDPPFLRRLAFTAGLFLLGSSTIGAGGFSAARRHLEHELAPK
jgi:hypothetical protein